MSITIQELAKAFNEKGIPIVFPSDDPLCKCGHLESQHCSNCEPAECGEENCLCNGFVEPIACPACGGTRLHVCRGTGTVPIYVECTNPNCYWTQEPSEDLVLLAAVETYRAEQNRG